MFIDMSCWSVKHEWKSQWQTCTFLTGAQLAGVDFDGSHSGNLMSDGKVAAQKLFRMKGSWSLRGRSVICSHLYTTTVTGVFLCWEVVTRNFFLCLCFQGAVDNEKGHSCSCVGTNGARSQQPGKQCGMFWVCSVSSRKNYCWLGQQRENWSAGKAWLTEILPPPR